MNSNITGPPVTIASTAGGILLAVINIHSGEMLKTALLAAIGAAVSFAVTMLMKYVYRKVFREYRR